MMKMTGVWLAAALAIGLTGCGSASPGSMLPGEVNPHPSGSESGGPSNAGETAKAGAPDTAPEPAGATSASSATKADSDTANADLNAANADLNAASVESTALTMEELKKKKNLWIDCNLSLQRIYIKDGDQVLKEMVTSSGLDTNPDNMTPRGTFQILPYRDTWFYNPQVQEGAMYWVAFKGTEFLFHSVPMDQNQHIIPSEAQKLGQKASHGCLRLSMADAKWFYENIPVGTKVVIHD